MLIWSQNKTSFVDFADGYSYLPLIPVNFGFRPENIQPEDVSVLFHEFTHQLALKGPFGWLCAYFQSIRPMVRIFSELQANIEFPGVFSAFAHDQGKSKTYAELLGLETFYEVYGDCMANYLDLIECYRWVLEGIALFVQFDYKSSTEFDAASDLFYFAAELVKTEKFRSENQMKLSDINDYINEARQSKYSSGLLQYFLENTRVDTAPYFMGYLMIREIQRGLAEKDRRFSDPELFFIFIQNYFFLDAQLIDLCIVEPRHDYQERAASFLQKRIRDLLNAESEKLRTVMDLVCDYQHAQMNYVYVDFAAVVREGRIVSWNEQEILNGFFNRISALSDKLVLQNVFANHRDIPEFLAQTQAGVRTAEFLFNVLRYVMLSFKLKHMHMAMLGYNLDKDRATVTTVGVSGTPMRIMDTIPLEEFLPLIQEAESGQFEIARNSGTRMPSELLKAFSGGDSGAFLDLLSKLYDGDRLLIVQDYDLYLINGRERCRVWVRGDFLHVEPYHWKPNSDEHSITSLEDLQMLKMLGRFFYHAEYWDMVQVPRIKDGPQVLHDEEFGQGILVELWKTTHPKVNASKKEVLAFAKQKGKIIAVTEGEDNLLSTLCLGNPFPQDYMNEVLSINRRWQYFTGRHLIDVKENTATAPRIDL